LFLEEVALENAVFYDRPKETSEPGAAPQGC